MDLLDNPFALQDLLEVRPHLMLTAATHDDFSETGQSSVRAGPTVFLGPIRHILNRKSAAIQKHLSSNG
jgi:hypothetical protein